MVDVAAAGRLGVWAVGAIDIGRTVWLEMDCDDRGHSVDGASMPESQPEALHRKFHFKFMSLAIFLKQEDMCSDVQVDRGYFCSQRVSISSVLAMFSFLLAMGDAADGLRHPDAWLLLARHAQHRMHRIQWLWPHGQGCRGRALRSRLLQQMAGRVPCVQVSCMFCDDKSPLV